MSYLRLNISNPN